MSLLGEDQGVGMAAFLREALWKNLFTCLFQLLQVINGELRLLHITLISSVVRSPSALFYSSSTFEDPCDYTGSIQEIRDNLPICKVLLFCKVTDLHIPGIRMWTSLRRVLFCFTVTNSVLKSTVGPKSPTSV